MARQNGWQPSNGVPFGVVVGQSGVELIHGSNDCLSQLNGNLKEITHRPKLTLNSQWISNIYIRIGTELRHITFKTPSLGVCNSIWK